VEDVAKSNASKKSPYVNPERVKTGGLPRVLSLALTSGSTSYLVCISGQIVRRGTRRENGTHARTE